MPLSNTRTVQVLMVTFLISCVPTAPTKLAELTTDPRGVIPEARVAGKTFLTDVGVSLTAPGWQGNRGDQRGVSPSAVKRTTQGGATVLTAKIASAGLAVCLREVFRPIPGGARLEYEIVPEADIEVENVLWLGRIPVAGHAGTTRYVAVGDDFVTGTCPEDLAASSYAFLPGRAHDWLALVAQDGTALRIKPEGMTLGLQDDRKFGATSFALHGLVGRRRTLKAGEPVHFAVELTADTASAVNAEAMRSSQAAWAGVPLSSKARLRAGTVSVDRKPVPVFERVEIIPDIEATFDNPFDPDDVAVDAEIATPGGVKQRVPGFYYVPCRVEAKEGRERIRPAGSPCWKVRFTPTTPGEYRVIVRARDRSGEAECPPVRIAAIPSRHRGFVRVAEASPSYFRCDDGGAFFPVGENICWASGPTPLRDYADWFRGLSQAGGNWARLWLAATEKGLEWSPPPMTRGSRGLYLGLGRYSIENSWRLDQVMQLAEENHVWVMLCIGTFGEIKETKDFFGANYWNSNPYNAANGGPCRVPGDFFTDPTARQLYKRRLRYLIARWGYSSYVFAWEFWNEYKAPAAWVQEMAAYLKEHDANRHMVSTTYGDDDVWKLPEVDFTMTHHYGDTGNIADFGDLIELNSRKHRVYGKPYFIAEYGIDWRTNDERYDPQGKGQNLHNGLWAGIMAGGAGTPMIWYWDGYVHGKNLYRTFTPAVKFVAAVDWAHSRFAPVDGIAIENVGKAPESFSDMDIAPGLAWGKTGSDTYTVRRDGVLEGGPPTATLGSPTRPPELYSKLTFHLDMPADGEFVTRVGVVSSKARLQLRVDGALKVDEPLSTGPAGQGPWKTATYQEQWKCWQSDYDKDYTVRVPAGKHTVTVENAEGDWLNLRLWRIPRYRSSRYPDVRALGLRAERTALLWVHHRKSTWKTVLDGEEPLLLSNLRVTMPNTPDGLYRVEWWDTYSGKLLRTEKEAPQQGRLRLAPPEFARDVAAIIRPETGR